MLTARATRRTIVALIVMSVLANVAGRPPRAPQLVIGEPSSSGEAENVVETGYTRIALPAIDVGDGWVTQVHVQNVGNQPTMAVLDFYSTLYGRLCPIKGGQDLVGTRCNGVIVPGTTQTLELTEGIDLDEAKSAVAYSVVPDSEDEPCGGSGSRELGQPLAITVTRLRRQENGQPPVSSTYTGIFSFASNSQMRYRTFAPLAVADDQQTHEIAIQNLGNVCSTFQRWYFRQDNPGRALFEWVDIEPGATVRVDDVIWFQPFIGSAWVRASSLSQQDTPVPPQPLAVVVDQWGEQGGQLMTYSGVPGSSATSINYAPVIYKNVDGWHTELQIQNAGLWSASFRWASPIKAAVSFLDLNGNTLTTLNQEIEGWNSWRISVQDNTDLPGSWFGAVQIRSEATSGQPDVPPRSLAVVSLTGKKGQALSYSSLQPPQQSGVGAALPWLVKGYSESYGPAASTQTSQIALQNLNPNPGVTRFRVDFYDEETVVGSLVDQLDEGEVRLVNLHEIGFLPDGFHGSALIHLKETTQTGYAAIGAIVIETAEGAVRGDLARAYEGVPLASSMARSDQHYLPLITIGRQP